MLYVKSTKNIIFWIFVCDYFHGSFKI